MAAAITRNLARNGSRLPSRVVMGLVPIPIALTRIALGLVAYFDLQTNVSRVDEYGRGWTIQHLADGHGWVLWGFNPNFLEMAVALPAARLHLEPRFWRLAGLPFIATGGVFASLIASRLEADRFWARMAASIVVLHTHRLVAGHGHDDGVGACNGRPDPGRTSCYQPPSQGEPGVRRIVIAFSDSGSP